MNITAVLELFLYNLEMGGHKTALSWTGGLTLGQATGSSRHPATEPGHEVEEEVHERVTRCVGQSPGRVSGTPSQRTGFDRPRRRVLPRLPLRGGVRVGPVYRAPR